LSQVVDGSVNYLAGILKCKRTVLVCQAQNWLIARHRAEPDHGTCVIHNARNVIIKKYFCETKT
jgi:hypothetical protein